MDYSKGSLSKHRGRWRAQIRYKDGAGAWRTVSKVLDVPCDQKSNRGKAAAQAALDAWRADLIQADARGRPAGRPGRRMTPVRGFHGPEGPRAWKRPAQGATVHRAGQRQGRGIAARPRKRG